MSKPVSAPAGAQVSVFLEQGAVGGVSKGVVALDGLNVSRAVREVKFRGSAGHVSVISLELVNVEFEANLDNALPLIWFVKDGWKLYRHATPEMIGLLAKLHDLLDEAPDADSLASFVESEPA